MAYITYGYGNFELARRYATYSLHKGSVMFTKSLLAALVFVFCFPTLPASAQKVACDVQVNYESIPTTNKDLLRDFQSDIDNYINNFSWGSDELDDKIKCTMTIFLKSVVGENRYSAQAFIGSQRQILNSEKSTAVVRLFDETWEFTYVRNRPINHNPYSFNDLTSFLDFYIYLILGYDYDTYGELAGSPMFQKAADIASLGRSSGQRGWQQSNANYNRIQLIDELMNPKFNQVRTASYTYHFTGLDSLTANSVNSMSNILKSIHKIGKARREADPRNIAIRVFFDTKYLELADLFLTYPDASVYVTLSNVDQAHRTTYEEYGARRK